MDNNITTLDAFVTNILEGFLGDSQHKLYARVYRLSAMAIKELRLNLLPTYKSNVFQVAENLTVALPSEAMAPISVDKYIRVGNTDCVYPLRLVKDVSQNVYEIVQKPANAWACPEVPDSVDPDTLTHSYDYYSNSGTRTAFYMPHYYGEYFGYSESRYYGQYYWDKTNPDVVVFGPGGCISIGDNVIIRYSVSDAQLNILPIDMVPIIRTRVLQWYWEASNTSKSQYYKREFQGEIAQRQRGLNTFDYDELIDAHIRGYSSNNV